MPRFVKANSYINMPEINNDTTSKNLSSTVSKAHVPPIDNECGGFFNKV